MIAYAKPLIIAICQYGILDLLKITQVYVRRVMCIQKSWSAHTKKYVWRMCVFLKLFIFVICYINAQLASSGQNWSDDYIFSFIGKMDTTTNFISRCIIVLPIIIFVFVCLTILLLLYRCTPSVPTMHPKTIVKREVHWYEKTFFLVLFVAKIAFYKILM